jgi:hypothetical protein
MRQGAWQQRRGKGSIETIADETAWEALSGVGEAKGKERARACKVPGKGLCLSRLCRNSHFPVLTPPYSISSPPPPSLSSVQFCSILPLSFPPLSHLHSEGPRGVTTFAVFSLISNSPDRRALSG